jgi:hypothetical protein
VTWAQLGKFDVGVGGQQAQTESLGLARHKITDAMTLASRAR